MEVDDFYRSIVELNSDLIVRWKPDCTINFANPAYIKFFGISDSEIPGKSFLDFIPQGEHQKIKDYIKGFSSLMTSGSCVHIVKDSRGAQRWISWIDFALFDNNNQISEFQSVGRDVTDQKDYELKIRNMNRELEKYAKEKTAELIEQKRMLQRLVLEMNLAEERERIRIASGLHDNVGQLLSLVKLKLGQLYGLIEDNREASELTEIIINSMEQALKVLRNFTFNLGSPILYELGLKAAVTDLCDKTYKEHGIQFYIDLLELEEPEDKGMIGFLFQVVKELIVNIIKHSKAGIARIKIKSKRDSILIQVQDNGIGFDSVRAFQFSNEQAGFGLFNIKERLESIGGFIDIKSSDNLGSKIKVMVPMTVIGCSHEN